MIKMEMVNVLLLSLGFFCVQTAYVTIGSVQKFLINSIHQEDSSFDVNGYVGLCLDFAFVGITVWTIPSVMSVIGSRATLAIGTIFQMIWQLQFFYPLNWLYYVASAILGIAGGFYWTAQGYCLTSNSTKDTITRNSGIFWAIMQSGRFFGNLYVYISFKDPIIEKHKRYELFGIMAVLCFGACIFFVVIRKAVYPSHIKFNALHSFLKATKLFCKRDMVLLMFTFHYIGMHMTFFIGIYSNVVGFTTIFQEIVPMQIMALCGLLGGGGEVIGGTLFGLLGYKTARWGHYPIIILGFIVNAIAYIIISINSPNTAINQSTTDAAIIRSNQYLALFGAFLLGFGDACFTTQIYAILGIGFVHEISQAHAIFRFVQGLSTGLSFLVFTYIDGLYIILSILLVFSVLGTITFCVVEFKPTYISPPSSVAGSRISVNTNKD